DIANTLEAMVDTPARHLYDDLLNGFVMVIGVHEVGGTKLLGEFKFIRIGINGDDAASLGLHRTLYYCQSNTSQSEYGYRIALLHLCRMLHCTQTRRHAATEQAHMFGIRVGINLGKRNFSDSRVFAKGGATHIVIERLAVVAEAGCTIWHHTLTLGSPDGHAEIGL